MKEKIAARAGPAEQCTAHGREECMGCIWCCTRLLHLMSPALQDIKNRRELFMEPYAKAIRNSHVLTIHGKADETVSSQGPCAACLSIGPLLVCLSCLDFTSGVAPAAKALSAKQSCCIRQPQAWPEWAKSCRPACSLAFHLSLLLPADSF